MGLNGVNGLQNRSKKKKERRDFSFITKVLKDLEIDTDLLKNKEIMSLLRNFVLKFMEQYRAYKFKTIAGDDFDYEIDLRADYGWAASHHAYDPLEVKSEENANRYHEDFESYYFQSAPLDEYKEFLELLKGKRHNKNGFTPDIRIFTSKDKVYVSIASEQGVITQYIIGKNKKNGNIGYVKSTSIGMKNAETGEEIKDFMKVFEMKLFNRDGEVLSGRRETYLHDQIEPSNTEVMNLTTFQYEPIIELDLSKPRHVEINAGKRGENTNASDVSEENTEKRNIQGVKSKTGKFKCISDKWKNLKILINRRRAHNRMLKAIGLDR